MYTTDGIDIGFNKRIEIGPLISAKNVLFWSWNMDTMRLSIESQTSIFWYTCNFLEIYNVFFESSIGTSGETSDGFILRSKKGTVLVYLDTENYPDLFI